MLVRPADAADLPVLTALETDLFGPDAWSTDVLRAALPDVLVAVASGEGGGVVGYAALRVGADATADLDRVAVQPGVRRRGVASLLLEAALARAAAAEQVLLEVSEQNAGALAFYARHGFVEIDRRRRYYRDGSDALVLRRPPG